MYKVFLSGTLLVLLILSGCATSNHGSFVNSTYVKNSNQENSVILGKVEGESRQVWFLYIFPIGESPSTNKALLNAKSKIKGTTFLTDVSIDDRTYWKFGYNEQVIEVDAVAHQ